MSKDLEEGWKRYITHVVTRSPALVSFWERNKEWYTLIELEEIADPAGEFTLLLLHQLPMHRPKIAGVAGQRAGT